MTSRAPSGWSPNDQHFAVSTYRYLRLAIVTVVIALVVSLVLERSHAPCWNGSISSYYYTPVHSIFVAALGVIGVALFAIRGGTLAEDILLNMAAFLAPVVAFVPTGWSSADCPSNLTATSKTAVDHLLRGNRFFAKFATNNLVALIIGALIGLSLATAVTLIRRRRAGTSSEASRPVGARKELVVPALGSVSVVVAGFIWHRVWPASFSTHAHSYAAILMFILVALVMLSTAERDELRAYRTIYFACPAVMALGGGVVGVVGALVTWRHSVLVLEIIELSMFVVFWLVQTMELWDAGVPSPEEYDRPLRALSQRQWRRVVGGPRPGGVPGRG